MSVMFGICSITKSYYRI